MDEGLDDGVVTRLGDLQVRAPRTLEELSGDRVVRSFDLTEWSAGIAVSRRWKLGTASILLAAVFAWTPVARAWSWFVVGPTVVVLAAFAAVCFMRKTYLILYRGDAQVTFHLWDGGQGEAALVAFTGLVTGAAKIGGEPLEPS